MAPKEIEFREKITEQFVIYCDENSYDLDEGIRLADELMNDLDWASQDRERYLEEENPLTKLFNNPNIKAIRPTGTATGQQM